MGKNQWVTTRPDGKWQVKGEGNQKATAVTNTQKEAINIARNIAINQQSELIVQNKESRIRQKDSFGPDSNPPKG